jgi:hypothetical protein
VLVELANNAKIITWINNYVEHYAVGEAWDNKRGLRSSAKVIYTIKYYKAVSIREWHISSSSGKIWVFKSFIMLW